MFISIFIGISVEAHHEQSTKSSKCECKLILSTCTDQITEAHKQVVLPAEVVFASPTVPLSTGILYS